VQDHDYIALCTLRTNSHAIGFQLHLLSELLGTVATSTLSSSWHFPKTSRSIPPPYQALILGLQFQVKPVEPSSTSIPCWNGPDELS